MKFTEFIMKTLISGLLVIAPLYLAILLLLKAAKSLTGLVSPIAALLPDWLPAGNLLSLLLVLLICLAVGLLIHTRIGKAAKDAIENRMLRSLPGYATIRSLTQRLVGEDDNRAWKPALSEIEEALVPSFIIEELKDGRFTVFVPSVPTPFAGAVYVLDPVRVHPVNISFAQAIRAVSQWGAGCENFVAAMEKPG
jgi:uncharacterized membrane protein